MLDNDNGSVLFLNSFVQFLNFISIMEFQDIELQKVHIKIEVNIDF